ncbi:hypothetical protein MBAV_000349 [Candidatus Magnetobacterium bavaricum]|uniref:Uncharacterized protein n=1 Tax=Candidatus Magnetobacterium bavaricum TaxID=29290 RepID=A0A0F3H000_9BACT|nr:hypothetical protein MBAV_000349 [Candidatus Magnetobacterium bavaricum]
MRVDLLAVIQVLDNDQGRLDVLDIDNGRSFFIGAKYPSNGLLGIAESNRRLNNLWVVQGCMELVKTIDVIAYDNVNVFIPVCGGVVVALRCKSHPLTVNKGDKLNEFPTGVYIPKSHGLIARP